MNRSRPAKSPGQVLFPEERVGRFKVRPLSLGDAEDLAPVLMKAVAEAQRAGLTVDNFAQRLPEFVGFLLPHASEIFSVVLKVPREEAREVPLDEAIAILSLVISQNTEHLKNSSALKALVERLPKGAG